MNSCNIAKANAELSAVRTAISAYQSENAALLPTVGGTAGAVTNSLIQPYVQGTLAGTYTLNAAGNISAATYLTFTFDGTKFK